MTKRVHYLRPIWRFLLQEYWWVGALLCYIVITNWLLWPYPSRATTTVIHEGDPIHQLWTLRWIQHILFTQPLRLFSANSNYPYNDALTLNQPMYSNAVLTAPIYVLTQNQILTFNFGVIISFVLSGLFTSFLVYELTKSRSASIISGIIYAFSPVRQAHIAHLNILSSYWTPLVLWGVHRIMRPRHRIENSTANRKADKKNLQSRGLTISAFVVCFAFAAQVLAEYYHAIYLVVALCLVVSWKLALQRRMLAKQSLVMLILGCLMGLLITLPVVTITAREWANLDLVRPLSTHDQYGARLTSYIATDQPLPLKPLLEKIPGSGSSFRSVELALYPGVFALFLAVLALAVTPARQRVDMTAYLLIGIVAFYFSLGPTIRIMDDSLGVPSPLYRWFYVNVPGFQGARIPARWAILFQLSVAVLAGYTVTYFLSLCNRTIISYVLTWLIIVALLIDFWGVPGQRGIQIDTWKLSPIVEQILNESPPGAVLHYPLTNANENLPYFYEYLSTNNWQPIVNSGSNVTPPAYVDIRDILSSFPQSQSVKLLQSLGVKYVIVHRSQMSGWQAWWDKVSATASVNVLAFDPTTQDALLSIKPVMPESEIIAELLSSTQDESHLYVLVSEPEIFDQAHLYEQRRVVNIGLEEGDGKVTSTKVEFPTYIYRNRIISIPHSLTNVVAIQVPTSDGRTVRINIRPNLRLSTVTKGLQLFGTPVPKNAQSGDFLQCLIYGRGETTEDLVLSLSLWDKSGNMQFKQDRFFNEGFAPPKQWEDNRSEPIPCNILIPDNLPTGEYNFSISLYNPNTGQPVPFSTSTGITGTYWDQQVYIHN